MAKVELSPRTIGRVAFKASKLKEKGAIQLTDKQAEWVLSMFAADRSPAMHGVISGLVAFDSRPWLHEIGAPTLVIRGTHDDGVPQHHFDMLVNGIPGARGRLVDRAVHALAWTHTRELADIIRSA